MSATPKIGGWSYIYDYNNVPTSKFYFLANSAQVPGTHGVMPYTMPSDGNTWCGESNVQSFGSILNLHIGTNPATEPVVTEIVTTVADR
jgi:hypothetical protein